MSGPGSLQLGEGARIAVVGGGPAGSFFGYFAQRMAERIGRRLHIDLYEPRDYSCRGPNPICRC